MVDIRLLCVAAAGLIATAAGAASADPITITSGSMTVGGFARGAFRSTSFSLLGNDGFAISGGMADGPATAVPPCSQFSPCGAGATTNPSGSFNENGASGSATLNGSSFPLVLYRSDPDFANNTSFTFTGGDVVLPSSTSDTIDLQSSFLFSGLASIWTVGASNTPTFNGDFSLIGRGIATTHLSRFGSGYAVTGFTYQFENGGASPTPEPASLLLLGTGLAAAWQSHRRRVRVASDPAR
jgi:hypothetical protein